MEKPTAPRDLSGPDSPHFSDPAGAASAGPAEYAAWEEVEAGRYMPRRVRGSCQGRVLG